MGSWTLSSSPAQYTLKQRTYPLSATCLLSCAFPPSSAAFPPLLFLNSSSSLRFCSRFARVPLPISPDGSEGGDVIILHVTGMTCGGCSASVKRILENQPQVSSATVNLTTETAIVLPVTEAKTSPNWSKQLGESLAKHLSSCGFPSNLGGDTVLDLEGDNQL